MSSLIVAGEFLRSYSPQHKLSDHDPGALLPCEAPIS